MFWFGPFRFDPRSGELARDGSLVRLTPQTAHVLQVLLENGGQVVTRAEVHARVWPDTTVEFDQGLNFCIRQLRIALTDDAARPSFIETLPKRGYRLLVPVSRGAPSEDQRAAVEPTPAQQPSGRSLTVSMAGAIAVILIAGVLFAAVSRRSSATPLALAVVPFDVEPPAPDLTAYRDRLAESVVDHATRALSGVTVMGPSTTHEFGSRTLVDSIGTRTGASFVLSGVVRRRGNAIDVFAQLIRASDRGHIWVARWLDSSTASDPDFPALGQRLADSVNAVLLHPERRHPLR